MEGNLSFTKYCFGALLIASAAFTVSYRSAHVDKLLRNLSTPHSGEHEVLPPEVIPVLDYVRQSGVRSIELSKLLSENRFMAQPITESVYPVVVADQGQLYVSYLSEPLPAGCVTLKETKKVRIASCR